ncbi:ATP-grasp domain-containing protein [Halobacillus hunanensis]|uniref:ATP-grasp domain-containing protein n=1 Tax=Halobacillus hunanensis TaxID=578214 RepID=UPI0009A7A968|nr:ATP-grasp domain-containing protein [Halobacillus hunanensis]
MKKVLIVGAGFLQAFVIRKAKEMGYYTITIDGNPNSIGFKYADDFSVIDIVDQKACLKYAQAMKIDGVMTAATDYGVLSTAYIAKEMNLPGLKNEVAKVIKNKYIVRRELFRKNVDDVSQYYEISNTDELDEIRNLIKFPVMIKPCDGSGSKATKKVDSYSDLLDACDRAIKASLIGKALIEDFIEGKEYGIESLVYNGKVYVLGVMGKYMTNPPDFAELGHFIPSQLPIERDVKEVAKNAIEALGINFGAVNMDVLVTKDNRICIIDIGARMGGNLIGSHIIPVGTGVDYMGSLIRASLGDTVDFETQKSGVNVVTKILALDPGEVIGLPNFSIIKEKFGVDIYHDLKVGSLISEYHNNLDGNGYVVSVAKDIRKAEKRAEETKNMINKGIRRG